MGLSVTSLREVTPELVSGINRLLPQLSPSASEITPERLDALLRTPCVRMFGAYVDGAFAGMLTLIVAPIPTGFHGYIEDVVVDGVFRGRGIAEQLVRTALEAARGAGAEKVDLTSNPSRDSATRLYLRIGFERCETNVYRFMLAGYPDVTGTQQSRPVPDN